MAFFFLPYQTFGSTIMAILTKNTRQNIVNCYSDSHDFFFSLMNYAAKIVIVQALLPTSACV